MTKEGILMPGVYMMTSRSTGDTYVGASEWLTQRISTHLAAIRNRKAPEKFLRAFKDESDIEFRILEYVKIRHVPYHVQVSSPKWSKYRNRERSDRELLRERERHWIFKLQPSLNKNNKARRVCLDELPVGEPVAK